MDCNVTEPLCSIWSSDCTYRRHPNIRLREHTFQGFENKDYEFMLIVAIKLLLASIGLYLGKKILWFMYWLLFQPFNWTKDLTDTGYYHIKSRSNMHKIDSINRARRLRRTGDRMPPPYPNGWYGIAESRDVRHEAVISVNALGENFAVFRTRKGEIHILNAYCPHLGANLGVGGIVRGDCIECPFHQWTFRGSDGACVAIPYSSDGTIPRNTHIKSWPACEVNECIFVFYHADDVEPWRLLPIEEIDNGELIYQGRNEFLVNCHCQEIPENGADVAHLSAVHGPSMLTGSDLRFTRAEWATFSSHAWNASWESGGDQAKHIAMIELTHAIRLFNKFDICSMEVDVQQVGPGYVQLFISSALGQFVVLQTVVPVEPLLQKVIHRFYQRSFTAVISKFLIWGESIMFERDMMVWNNKRYLESPRLVKEDRNIKAFRNWFQQFYSESSKSFADARGTLEW